MRSSRITGLWLVTSAFFIGADRSVGQPGATDRGAVLPKLELVTKFDKDGDGRLDSPERHAALEHLAANPQLRRPGRSPSGGPTGPPAAGVKLTPSDVTSYPATIPLFDAGTLRTVFLDFEDKDWEKQLAAFHRTDVLVPAKMVVDGKTYRDVGVHFRGNNSFSTTRDGYKRSITLDLDFVHADQALLGYRGLHLLNANEDPSFLRTVLYLEIARYYALINNEGYWNDGCVFAIYQDPKGKFHVLPHDANEGFRPARGKRGLGGDGVKLDPSVATNDPNKALRAKLLAMPAYRAKYLG